MTKQNKKSRGKYVKWLEPNNLLLLESWARKLTNEQIAANIGINPKTLYDWMSKYPAIGEAVSKGKAVIVAEVENALIKRALGYEYEEVKHKQSDDGVEVTVTTKHVIPDTTAQIFILKNMDPDDWRDKQEISATVNSTSEQIQAVNDYINSRRNDSS